jgi:hypothetical protein
MAAPFLVAVIAVAGLGAADGGYFASDWGLATLGFALIVVTLVLVTDASRPSGLELAFLVAEGAAQSITDAAYRYARHEQGVDVVLFGTGNKAHVKDNVDSILRPPLAPPIIERLHATFGHLTGVGLDRPGPVKK